jgi:hypothetical protein
MAYKQSNQTKEKVKNLFSKERPVENPYEVWKTADGSWEWRILKKWQTDDNKPYARWLCAVKSPMTYGGFDIGDVYVKSIKSSAMKIEENGKPVAPEFSFKIKGNQEIFKERSEAFNKLEGLRIGDYVQEKDGKLTRVTHIHRYRDTPEKEVGVQTGGNSGSYYIGEDGYLEYSGGLDSGYKLGQLEKTDKKEKGSVWFFDENIAGGGRGKHFDMEFDVWKVK